MAAAVEEFAFAGSNAGPAIVGGGAGVDVSIGVSVTGLASWRRRKMPTRFPEVAATGTLRAMARLSGATTLRMTLFPSLVTE